VLFRSFRNLIADDRYYDGAEVVAAQEDARGAALKFADGTIVEADLVIGADGIGSRVRPAVAGRDSVPRYVGYAAWRSLLPEAKLTAIARAVLSERFAFYDAPNVHALGYLVPGADGSLEAGHRRYNCVWYRPHSESDGELASILTDRQGVTHPYSLSPGMMSDQWRQELIEAAAALLPPPFSSVIAAEEAPFIQAICDYVTPAMASHRIALLGDAAFVVRPHTAMGVSKAAGDALSLNTCLQISRDLPEAMKRYNAERWPVGREIAAYGQRLGHTLALSREVGA
jgi:2-polyprenyl-6-methoxyphenol hydroxylase-like FAD-dependent oxidoreductase